MALEGKNLVSYKSMYKEPFVTGLLFYGSIKKWGDFHLCWHKNPLCFWFSSALVMHYMVPVKRRSVWKSKKKGGSKTIRTEENSCLVTPGLHLVQHSISNQWLLGSP